MALNVCTKCGQSTYNVTLLCNRCLDYYEHVHAWRKKQARKQSAYAKSKKKGEPQVAMILQAVIDANEDATMEEIEAARDAVRRALQMTVDAVPFLDSVEVVALDDNGDEVVFTPAEASDAADGD